MHVVFQINVNILREDNKKNNNNIILNFYFLTSVRVLITLDFNHTNNGIYWRQRTYLCVGYSCFKEIIWCAVDVIYVTITVSCIGVASLSNIHNVLILDHYTTKVSVWRSGNGVWLVIGQKWVQTPSTLIRNMWYHSIQSELSVI